LFLNKSREGETQLREITIGNNKAVVISEGSIMDNSIVLFAVKGRVVQFYSNGTDIDQNNGDNFFRKMLASFEIL
jgi:hypothetical protein